MLGQRPRGRSVHVRRSRRMGHWPARRLGRLSGVLSTLCTLALLVNLLAPATAVFAAGPTISTSGTTLNYPANSGPAVVDSGINVASTPLNILTATVVVDTNYKH